MWIVTFNVLNVIDFFEVLQKCVDAFIIWHSSSNVNGQVIVAAHKTKICSVVQKHLDSPLVAVVRQPVERCHLGDLSAFILICADL